MPRQTRSSGKEAEKGKGKGATSMPPPPPPQHHPTSRACTPAQATPPQTGSYSFKSPEGCARLRAQADGSTAKLTGEELQEAVRDLQAEAKSLSPVVQESSKMSATRNKPRAGPNQESTDDAHEELNMWHQIKKDLEKLDTIQKRQRQVGPAIKDLEEAMAKQILPTAKQQDELDALYREMIRLTSEEQRLLNEEPADLRKNVDILLALRRASAADSEQRSSSSKPPRKPKANKLDMDGAGGDSPGPSPGLVNPAGRFNKSNPHRSASVASARDIKVEEGAEGAKGPSAEKAGKFFVGAEVAYKQAKPKEDGSQWIQCIILSINTSGNKKRYEVQDPEPDETGAPGDVYTASAAVLMAIPPADAELPDYPVGKTVLARYPETTTFYRAEVTGMKKGVCRLKFEDDQNQEMEVDRRFVLSLDK